MGKKSELILLWAPEDLEEPPVEQVRNTRAAEMTDASQKCSQLLFYLVGYLPLHAGGGAAQSGRRAHEIQRRAAEARGEPIMNVQTPRGAL